MVNQRLPRLFLTSLQARGFVVDQEQWLARRRANWQAGFGARGHDDDRDDLVLQRVDLNELEAGLFEGVSLEQRRQTDTPRVP